MAAVASSTSDLCYATATELARRIRNREISSAEVTEAFLARIAAHNSKLNAIVHVFERNARSRAKEADEALGRGENWGPFMVSP
jgi:amidase